MLAKTAGDEPAQLGTTPSSGCSPSTGCAPARCVGWQSRISTGSGRDPGRAVEELAGREAAARAERGQRDRALPAPWLAPRAPSRIVFLTLRAPHGRCPPAAYTSRPSIPVGSPTGRARDGVRTACVMRAPDTWSSPGRSFKEVGDHLGHRSPDATRVYAKVGLVSLRRVALSESGGLGHDPDRGHRELSEPQAVDWERSFRQMPASCTPSLRTCPRNVSLESNQPRGHARRFAVAGAPHSVLGEEASHPAWLLQLPAMARGPSSGVATSATPGPECRAPFQPTSTRTTSCGGCSKQRQSWNPAAGQPSPDLPDPAPGALRRGLRPGEAFGCGAATSTWHARILAIWDTKFFKSRLVPIGTDLCHRPSMTYWTIRQQLPCPDETRSASSAPRTGRAISLASSRRSSFGSASTPGSTAARIAGSRACMTVGIRLQCIA